jgi:hypothetical protein
MDAYVHGLEVRQAALEAAQAAVDAEQDRVEALPFRPWTLAAFARAGMNSPSTSGAAYSGPSWTACSSGAGRAASPLSDRVFSCWRGEAPDALPGRASAGTSRCRSSSRTHTTPGWRSRRIASHVAASAS